MEELPRNLRVSGKRRAVFILVSALAGFLLVLYFFSPRFGLFKGLHVPSCHWNPEVNRAVSTEAMLENPFAHIANPSNKVIQWRLLFPLAAHAFKLPFTAYLFLPYIGCFLALCWITHVAWADTGDRVLAAAAAAFLCTTSWFFVSTGWLAYFDSWCILGLLLAAFGKRRHALVFACVFAPWVDERFLIGLPLALTVRAAYMDRSPRLDGRRLAADALVCLLAALPYFWIRAWLALSGKDAFSMDYLRGEAGTFWSGQTTFALAAWQALRMAWVFVIYFAVRSFSGKRILWGSWVAAVLLGTLIVGKAVAGDWSRSLSIMVPAGMMGVIQLWKDRSRQAKGLVLAALAANLVLPASHVTRSFKIPIFYLPVQVQNYLNPPSFMDPNYLNNAGISLFKAGKTEDSLTCLESAAKLDNANPLYRFHLGVVRYSSGDRRGAVRDIALAALLADPGSRAAFQAKAMLKKIRSGVGTALPSQ